jgi:spore coat polysaccharide biosynthesis predicted glycosyltransferase SpsG
MAPQIIFRCDAGDAPEIGTGHIARSKTLACALVESQSFTLEDICFFTRHDNGYHLGEKYLEGSGFNYQVFDNNILKANSKSEIDILCNQGADLILLDRLETSVELIKTLKSHNKKVVTFDDYGEGRIYADIAISSIFDDVPESKNLIKGYEYLILSKNEYHLSNFNENVQNIVATFGGNDNRDICSHFLENVESIPQDISIKIILGKIDKKILQSYVHQIELKKNKDNIEIFIFPDNYHQIISNADIAVSTGGLSIFEFSAYGIPTIGIPQYEHQLRTIENLEEHGISISGSEGMELSNAKFLDAINSLIGDNDLRKSMASNAINQIDGRGAHRIKDLFLKEFQEVFK